jgi:ABC-2 type transport system ATP-binding protein
MVSRLCRQDSREEFHAVADVDIEISQGEVVAILGPNGAGKTTTIRMIATLLEPTSGEISICDVDARRRPAMAREHLGVVLGGERSVYWKLTARENLSYFAALRRIPRRETAARVADVLADVELSDRADEYVERFSTGMRQRLVLARALLGRPAVLLLDEPTAGLDPQSSAHLRSRLRQLSDAGTTIVLTTHYMDEADQLADRVGIIDHGRVIALDRPRNLRKLVNADQVVAAELRLEQPDKAPVLVDAIGGFAKVVTCAPTGDVVRLILHCDREESLLPRLIAAAADCGAVVNRVQVQDVSLEDTFLALTGRGLRE